MAASIAILMILASGKGRKRKEKNPKHLKIGNFLEKKMEIVGDIWDNPVEEETASRMQTAIMAIER